VNTQVVQIHLMMISHSPPNHKFIQTHTPERSLPVRKSKTKFRFLTCWHCMQKSCGCWLTQGWINPPRIHRTRYRSTENHFLEFVLLGNVCVIHVRG
jgi:hypothetical protein